CTIERRGSCVAMRPLNRTISAASAPMAGDPPMYAKSLPLRAVNPREQRGDDETAHHRDVLLGDQPLAERRLRRQGPEGMRERDRRQREERQRAGAKPRAAAADDDQRRAGELQGDRADGKEPGWIQPEMRHLA